MWGSTASTPGQRPPLAKPLGLRSAPKHTPSTHPRPPPRASPPRAACAPPSRPSSASTRSSPRAALHRPASSARIGLPWTTGRKSKRRRANRRTPASRRRHPPHHPTTAGGCHTTPGISPSWGWFMKDVAPGRWGRGPWTPRPGLEAHKRSWIRLERGPTAGSLGKSRQNSLEDSLESYRKKGNIPAQTRIWYKN